MLFYKITEFHTLTLTYKYSLIYAIYHISFLIHRNVLDFK